MEMTLPTTRIDTTILSPHAMSNGVGSSPSPSCTTGSEDSTQPILLVDFPPPTQLQNGSSESLVSGGGGGARITPGFPPPVSYQVPSVQIPGHTLSNHGHGLDKVRSSIRNPPTTQYPLHNDLSNFTLVNLTNANEEEDEESQGEGRPMIPQQIVQQQPFRSEFRRVSASREAYLGSGGANVRVSSSLSSSEDSDTFLVPGRSCNGVGVRGGRREGENCQYRLQKQSPGPIQGSPTGANSHGFQQQTGNTRKRLKRKRSTGRRKSLGSRPLGRESEGSELFPICCCFPDDNRQNESQRYSGSSSLTSRYLRLSCVIVMIIFIATFTSIMVSLQRKVDSLSVEVNKLSSTTNVGTVAPNVGGTGNASTSTSQIEEMVAKMDRLNSSLSAVTSKLNELGEKVTNLEKQPSIDELRKDLAQLGSEMKGSIEELQKAVDILKRKAAEADKAKEEVVNNHPGSNVISDKVPSGGSPVDTNNVPNNVPNNALQQKQP